MKPILILILFATATMAQDQNGEIPFATSETSITVEAERFTKQSHDSTRRWEIRSERPGASAGAYIEVLPDTRTTHDDKLIEGENFTDEAGTMAVLEYEIEVKETGRYFVWARTWSSGTEDNGLHFGLDGQWPDSGRRWQTVKKGGWDWDCKQRTAEFHTGIPMQLWLDIDQPGKHSLMLSMREDGAKVDQISLRKGNGEIPFGKFQNVKREPDGNGDVVVSGELKQWHKVTLTLDGPFAAESDGLGDMAGCSPFTDLALNVTFTHESGTPSYLVPGYFAADGDAGNSSAESGTKWRAHLSPDRSGTWNYTISFTKGQHAAVEGGGEALPPFDGLKGSFNVAETDKAGHDFRCKGRLQYVGKHHLQFAGSKEYFLKAGPDSPETLLAYTDFDVTDKSEIDRIKTWDPHAADWKQGDPSWKDGKGKGLIGALNYLAAKGVNAFSFLTYNATGDGDNVWPFVGKDTKLNYDCSKLDQWGIVFDHATALGLYLHFKLQENEMDDDRRKGKDGGIAASLDGGKLGIERKLYCREIIARFGHALALNWNIGEENTQSSEEIRDMAKFLHDTDPYHHHIVLHTFPGQQDKVYGPLLGDKSLLTGVSLQNSWRQVNDVTLEWVRKSAAAGRPWVAANDEQNPAGLGVPPDPGYQGHDGFAVEKQLKGSKEEGNFKGKPYTMHDIRKHTLWGNLMAGGAGVEYYFGYSLPENDIECEDFRSRDKSWDYCRIALEFFRDQKIPFAEMQSANALIGNTKDDNSKYCFAKAGELYLVYLPDGGTTALDLSGGKGTFTVKWFNPREGGVLVSEDVAVWNGGSEATLTAPSSDDWLAVITKEPGSAPK